MLQENYTNDEEFEKCNTSQVSISHSDKQGKNLFKGIETLAVYAALFTDL